MSFEIDVKKIEEHIKIIGKYGLLSEGGVYRGLYTQEWASAVDKIKELMERAGLLVHIDAVGNLFGRVHGTDKTNSAILTGSHIDTVRGGGNYDGVLGILAGITAIEYLYKNYGSPKLNLEVVATCEEEGSRFNTSLWGSRAILGMLKSKDTLRYVDLQGVTIAKAMEERGYNPAEITSAARNDIKMFLELHIEQGGILEKEQIPVGIVKAITGIRQFVVEITGITNHAGTTPMVLRKDALRTAADMISKIGIIAEGIGSPAVATVGKISVEPGAKNVIAGKAFFTIDLRHPNKEKLEHMERKIFNLCNEVANNRGLLVKITKLVDNMPVRMNEKLVDTLKKIAKRQKIKYYEMISGAGHDSLVFANILDTAMLFVPSKNGKSHCPEEYTKSEDIFFGIKLLAEALHKVAY